PQEAADFENYVEGSEEARAEVAALSDTAVRLGLSTAAVQPSADLKTNLMAAIRKTPQLSAVDQSAVAEPLAVAEPVEARPTPAARTIGSAERRAQSRWYMRPVALLTAVAAAAALFVGGTFLGQNLGPRSDGNSALQAQASSLVELSAASDVQRASSVVAGGGKATLIWSLDLRRSAVLIDKLPALPAGKTYQLWYIDGSGAKPAGTFESSDGGMTWHVLDGKMTGGDTVGVTVEPDGGSAQPTTKPIVAIASA
ncbi:MAG: anti-sigma factor, partial [Lacisediminihabitans sp.]